MMSYSEQLTKIPSRFAVLPENPPVQDRMPDLRHRMVRELELFLSYALSSGQERRWIALVKASPLGQ